MTLLIASSKDPDNPVSFGFAQYLDIVRDKFEYFLCTVCVVCRNENLYYLCKSSLKGSTQSAAHVDCSAASSFLL